MKRFFKKAVACVLSFSVLAALPVTTYGATNLNDFPESYRPYIQQMINQHPLWNFEAYDTGVSWQDFLDYELEPGNNLIETSVPDFWLSKEQGVTYDGKTINLYNFSNGTYYIFSEPDWVQPTDSCIAYFMDPRNFLNDQDVFMFEHMIYYSYHTVDSINALLKGSWMANAPLEDDPKMTYAEAFLNIGKALNISPFLLAARVYQEQGRGESPLISGKYPGYEGYYNYFNIGATGQTQDEIIKNGLEEAKQEKWNSRFAALLGGAVKIYQRYTENGQTTLYFQKFDVASGQVSWRQYMQNVRAPLLEGRNIRDGYIDCGILESAFSFRIPVFRNMPASPCQIERPEIPGDVNYDGQVNAADSLAILKSVVNLQPLDNAQRQLADVDGNGIVDSSDSLAILKYVVHLLDKFPVAG